jgi:hypothetical protein
LRHPMGGCHRLSQARLGARTSCTG